MKKNNQSRLFEVFFSFFRCGDILGNYFRFKINVIALGQRGNLKTLTGTLINRTYYPLHLSLSLFRNLEKKQKWSGNEKKFQRVIIMKESNSERKARKQREREKKKNFYFFSTPILKLQSHTTYFGIVSRMIKIGDKNTMLDGKCLIDYYCNFFRYYYCRYCYRCCCCR